MPHVGREHCRFILPPYLHADPAFAANSHNWISFGTWEFHPRRRAGYLGGFDFFSRELGVGEEEEETDDDEAAYEDVVSEEGDEFEEEDAAEVEDAAQADGDDHLDVPAWDPETQPPDISEEEAVAIAIANSELDQLGMWDGLAVQLRDSSLA